MPPPLVGVKFNAFCDFETGVEVADTPEGSADVELVIVVGAPKLLMNEVLLLLVTVAPALAAAVLVVGRRGSEFVVDICATPMRLRGSVERVPANGSQSSDDEESVS